MKYIAILIMLIASVSGAAAYISGETDLSTWCAILFLMGAVFALESRVSALEKKVNERT